MGKEVKEKKKKILKESARNEVYDKLTLALGEYQNGHPKKFEDALQKASKLFVPFVLKKQTVIGEESFSEEQA
jgi:hypothetical protein